MASPYAGNPRLSDRQVRRIRHLYARGDITQKELAGRYKVPVGRIAGIVLGKTFRDVGGPIHTPSRKPFLSDEQVRELRDVYAQGGIAQKELAARYKVSASYLLGLVTGRYRSEAGGPFHTPQNSCRKLTDEQVQEIRRAYAAGEVTQATLAHRYGMNRSVISRLVRGKTFVHLDGPRVGTRSRPSGHKLTPQIVREILESTESDDRLGRKYKVSRQAIVKTRKRWALVDEEE